MIKQTAYVLHSRSYRESSVMVDLFTPDYGLIRCIGRGVKSQSSRGQGLQPFIEYYIHFHGQSDLKQLDQYEPQTLPLKLTGDALFSGFYVNEVILRALRSEADIEAQGLFNAYVDVLQNLSCQDNQRLELTLRVFEMTLLEYMGQSYEWAIDFKTGEVIEDDGYYGFFVEQGMSRVGSQFARKNPKLSFKGSALYALSQQNFSTPETFKTAKYFIDIKTTE